jgi:hypothetical protein
VLQDYQPFSDEKVVPWKEANDNVGRIGGWREYAREARAPQAAASGTRPQESTPAAEDPHSGHGKQ